MRPRYPKTDKNHNIVSELVTQVGTFRGLDLDCLDVSSLGGRCVDWILWMGPLAIAIEVKRDEPGWQLTEGEENFIDTNPGPKAIVQNIDDLMEVLSNWSNVAIELSKTIKDQY